MENIWRIITTMLRIFLFSLVFIALLSGCRSRANPTPTPSSVPTASPTETPPPTETPAPLETTDLIGTLQQMADLSRLIEAIQAADLAEKLSTSGPYTIFAPTNAAFAELSEQSLTDPDVMFDILLYHVVEGGYESDAIQGQTTLTTLLGDEMTLTRAGEAVQIGTVPLVSTDLEATNGVIHVIETVLIPPSLEDAP